MGPVRAVPFIMVLRCLSRGRLLPQPLVGATLGTKREENALPCESGATETVGGKRSPLVDYVFVDSQRIRTPAVHGCSGSSTSADSGARASFPRGRRQCAEGTQTPDGGCADSARHGPEARADSAEVPRGTPASSFSFRPLGLRPVSFAKVGSPGVCALCGAFSRLLPPSAGTLCGLSLAVCALCG